MDETALHLMMRVTELFQIEKQAPYYNFQISLENKKESKVTISFVSKMQLFKSHPRPTMYQKS